MISHDAEFLNSFTEALIYLDVFTHTTEQYVGNYYDAVAEISARVKKEHMKNAQIEKEIKQNKEKANYFSHKGGQMRMVAKRMRDKAEDLQDEKVEIKREDKTIKDFSIPMQENVKGEIINITSVSVMKNNKSIQKKVNISLRKNEHLLLSGPNGIGKSTLLESLVSGSNPGAFVSKGIEIGYYRQDFSNLDFEETVLKSLLSVTKHVNEEKMRAIAGGFLISGDLMKKKVSSLSEGQKGLLSFARLVLQKPGLLILDEPTNHMNFRHIPVIAKALSNYEGAMIIVSHVPDFIKKIRIDEILDLERAP